MLEFQLSNAPGSLSATLVHDYPGTAASSTLGDVQRLPGGNTLVTYSQAGAALEVDPSWAPVQKIEGVWGYADWRETLYGPPAR